MATLKDVAREAGVGTTTASVILNAPDKAERFSKSTIEHVKSVAKRLNYYPNHRAKSFRGGKTELIGVLLQTNNQSRIIRQPYWANLIAGIDDAVSAQNYSLTLLSSQDVTLDIGVRFFRERRIDGLLVTSPMLAQSSHVKDIPIVVSNCAPDATHYPSVVVEQDTGMQEALNTLKKAGHKKAVWIGPETWWDPTYKTREEAFSSICQELGIESSSYFFKTHNLQINRFDIISWSRQCLLEAMKHDPDFTAILCYNEETARGCYDALLSQGKKIPEDMSVIGFDNFYANFFSPPLSSIDSKIFEMGFTAGKMLLEVIKSPKDKPIKNPKVVLSTELISLQSH